MDWSRPLVVAGALTLTLAGAGQDASLAADMPRTLPPPGLPSPTYEGPRPQIFDSPNWYLRGDIGYEWGRTSGAQSAPGFASPTSSSFGNGMFGGVGIGVKKSWLRTDITAEYFAPMKYKGTIATADDVTANVSSLAALFNGYIDIGTWSRLTPYVGGGVGAARVRVSDYQSALAPPFTGDTSHTQWNFVWAAMAGLAYPIAPNLIVDLGYRYINFGDAKTGSDAFGSMTLKKLAAHQVRVGLRWSFDDIAVYR